MKTLIFFIIVAVSAYYLLSKTDKGSAFLSHYLPQQKIDKASNELLKNVDNRLQEVATKFAHEQQQGLQRLEQGISALSQQLNELEKQRSITKQQPQTPRKTQAKIRFRRSRLKLNGAMKMPFSKNS